MVGRKRGTVGNNTTDKHIAHWKFQISVQKPKVIKNAIFNIRSPRIDQRSLLKKYIKPQSFVHVLMILIFQALDCRLKVCMFHLHERK